MKLSCRSPFALVGTPRRATAGVSTLIFRAMFVLVGRRQLRVGDLEHGAGDAAVLSG
jgi:hypothetical protein